MCVEMLCLNGSALLVSTTMWWNILMRNTSQCVCVSFYIFMLLPFWDEAISALNIISLTKTTNLLPTQRWTTIILGMLNSFWLGDHEGLLSIANQNWNKFTKEG